MGAAGEQAARIGEHNGIEPRWRDRLKEEVCLTIAIEITRDEPVLIGGPCQSKRIARNRLAAGERTAAEIRQIAATLQ